MNGKAWNWRLWAGFALSLVAAFGYPFTFQITRSVFWIGLALCIAALVLLISGLRLAFGQPESYGGKVAGPILATFSVLLFALFGVMSYMMPKAYAVARNAPRVGNKAPDFALTDIQGSPVTLSQMLSAPLPDSSAPSRTPRGVPVLEFAVVSGPVLRRLSGAGHRAGLIRRGQRVSETRDG